MFPPDKIDLGFHFFVHVCEVDTVYLFFPQSKHMQVRWINMSVSECLRVLARWRPPRRLFDTVPVGINSMTLKMIKWVMKMNACFQTVLNGFIINSKYSPWTKATYSLVRVSTCVMTPR